MAYPGTRISLPHASGGNTLDVWYGGTIAHSEGDNTIIDHLGGVEDTLGLGTTGQQTPLVGRVRIGKANGEGEWLILPRFNTCPNGGMERWSLGTSIAVAASTTGVAGYGPDEWHLTTNANQASVIAQVSGLMNNSTNAARTRRNSGQTGIGVMVFERAYGTDEVIKLRGDYVSVNALAIAGANWSPASGNVTLRVACGTGTEGLRKGSAYTGETTLINQTFAVTAGGILVNPQYTSSVVVPANATQMTAQFEWTPVGTAGAADDITIDNVMIVPGTVPIPFLPRADDDYQCLRRLWVPTGSPSGQSTSAWPRFAAYSAAGSQPLMTVKFPVEMAKTPTGPVAGTWNATNCGQPTFTDFCISGCLMVVTVTALGMFDSFPNSSDDFVYFDARLT